MSTRTESTTKQGEGQPPTSRIPKCSWCGEYRAAPGSEFCALCRERQQPSPKPLAPITGRRTERETLCVWRRHDDQSPWLIYGPHRHLQRAFRTGVAVVVRNYDHEYRHVQLEHVGEPNADDYAWAHPVGTAVAKQQKIEVEQAKRRSSKPKIHSKRTGNTNRSRKARMR